MLFKWTSLPLCYGCRCTHSIKTSCSMGSMTPRTHQLYSFGDTPMRRLVELTCYALSIFFFVISGYCTTPASLCYTFNYLTCFPWCRRRLSVPCLCTSLSLFCTPCCHFFFVARSPIPQRKHVTPSPPLLLLATAPPFNAVSRRLCAPTPFKRFFFSWLPPRALLISPCCHTTANTMSRLLARTVASSPCIPELPTVNTVCLAILRPHHCSNTSFSLSSPLRTAVAQCVRRRRAVVLPRSLSLLRALRRTRRPVSQPQPSAPTSLPICGMSSLNALTYDC